MDDIDRLSLDFAIRHPESFARTLGQGEFDECERVLESLPADRKAAIVARLPATRIRQLFDSERQRPADWLVDAPFDDAVNLLSRISRDRRLALVNSLDDRDRQRQLLRHQQYPAHSVGALVAEIPLRVGAESLAAEVLAELQKLDDEAQGPVVIVDTEGRYLGVLDRWLLLLRSPQSGSVRDYLVAVKALRPETPVSAVAMSDEWHTRSWMPVIDHQRRVLGAVSREKVLRAAGVYSGDAQRGGDILLDLLADIVYLCEAMVLRTFSRKDAT
jgi:Mg/Co/Ni transporter MgtE